MGFLALTFSGDRAVAHLSESIGERPVEMRDGQVVLDLSSADGNDASINIRLPPEDQAMYPKGRVERAAKIGGVATLYLAGLIAVAIATLILAFRGL